MQTGFYVTMIRDDGKIGWLLGPYASEPTARQHVTRARDKACDIDGYNWFYAFGVTGITREIDKPLPAGKLNQLIGLED